MARWLIKLAGEQIDIEDLPRLFPSGDTFAVAEDGSVYLAGPEFENLSDPGEVWGRAPEVIDEMFPLVSLHYRLARKPGIEVVIREGDDGVRTRHMRLSAGTARGKAGVFGVSNGPSGLTEAQRGLAAISANPHLRSAARLWSDPHRSWQQLYVIYDELVAYLGKPPESFNPKLCDKNERVRFTRSTLTPETAGTASRHRTSYAIPPDKPMTLDEATEFILDLLGRVLRL